MSKNIRCLTSFQTCCLLEPVGQQPLIAPGVAKLFSTEAWTTCWCPCLWSWSSLQTQLRPSVHTSSQSVSFRASASPPWHVDRACLMCTKPLHIAAYKQYLRKTSVTLQASELQAAYKLRCHFASCHSMSCHLFSCHVMWFLYIHIRCGPKSSSYNAVSHHNHVTVISLGDIFVDILAFPSFAFFL